MSERTRYEPGTFCWADLGTTDVESGKSFYTSLFGWDYEEQSTDSGPYVMFSKNNKQVCAIYEQGSERLAAGWSPTWLSYVSVDDLDAATERAAELGAEIISDPLDVMDVGRMALAADPTGAMFAMWEPGSHIGATLVNDPGSMTWNELSTTDPALATEFYTQLFGWVTEGPHDEASRYTTIKVGDRTNGGIRKMSPGQDSGPNWLVYFTTDDLDRAAEVADDNGGNILVAPMKIPRGAPGARLAVVQDPQGAVFALYEGAIDD